jgi:hypothetical protein
MGDLLTACIEEGASVHSEMLDDWPERNRREVDQSAGDRNHTYVCRSQSHAGAHGED